MDKYKEMKERAVNSMSLLCKCNVDNTKESMMKARRMVYDRGNYMDQAHADFYFQQWTWADCEIWAHEGMAAEGK